MSLILGALPVGISPTEQAQPTPEMCKEPCWLGQAGWFTAQAAVGGLAGSANTAFRCAVCQQFIGRVVVRSGLGRSALDFGVVGGCVRDDRWGGRLLAESMPTCSNTRCSAESAVCSVLTYFHADGRLPKACFLHGRVTRGRTWTATSGALA